MQISEIIREEFDQMVADRRYLHQHPEVSHQEEHSAAYIAGRLREMGLEPQTGVGGHGVVAVIQGKKGPGKCVGLRADFDALPIPETTGLPFASENPGVSHSCGHDMHTGALLGVARTLLRLRDQFPGCVKLVFQPSEEDVTDGGARRMILDGVLENPKVDVMFGQHIWPAFPIGKVAIRDGGMMAASDQIRITIKGKSSHASTPDTGIDAIVAAAQVITALQTVVARKASPLESAVVTIGTIQGGNRYNVIADTVKLAGTCRNLSPEFRKRLPDLLRNLVEKTCEAMGATGELQYIHGYSPTINDHSLFPLALEAIRGVVGEENTVIPPSPAMGGEDFSYYCEKIPCCFFWTGSQDPSLEFCPIHNGNLRPAEEAMRIAGEVMTNMTLNYLNQN